MISSSSTDDDELPLQNLDEVDIEECVSNEVQVEVVPSSQESFRSGSDTMQCRILFSFGNGKANNMPLSSLVGDGDENYCPNYSATTTIDDDHFCLRAMPK